MSFFRRDKDQSQAPPAQGASPNMHQMVAMLASAPEEQRLAMLKDRLAVFADHDEATREQAMKGMLVAGLELPDSDYQKIAASRFKAMNDLDADTRMALMKSHATVVKGLSDELRQKEMKAMKQIVSGLPEDKRHQMMTMMQNLGLMDGGA